MSFSNTNIAHVVAHDRNRAIGKDNQLPWHISDDLKHFKRLTEGGIVIMGRNTYESMGKPLPNRTNIILTTDLTYTIDDPSVMIFHNLDDALGQASSLAHGKGLDTVWVIGGQKIFEQTLPFSDRLEITLVDTVVEGADVFYPNLPSNFAQASQSDTQTDPKNGLSYRFVTYHKL